ncbi:hypothetical protein QBC36DRAFT_313549 [Triangularia setosa]|uniref:Uncharacterized protein n=1 Tax=Triangularia setosa TaxID=2587417 RepID=A0AAN6W3V3_9PEZI|nr:hypothetical protein QBC36DRAFT_313549 [Podospora setosa]
MVGVKKRWATMQLLCWLQWKGLDTGNLNTTPASVTAGSGHQANLTTFQILSGWQSRRLNLFSRCLDRVLLPFGGLRKGQLFQRANLYLYLFIVAMSFCVESINTAWNFNSRCQAVLQKEALNWKKQFEEALQAQQKKAVAKEYPNQGFIIRCNIEAERVREVGRRVVEKKLEECEMNKPARRSGGKRTKTQRKKKV